MTLAPGARLGPFEVVGLIGAGGMGDVYRDGDTRLGGDVAIKVLPENAAIRVTDRPGRLPGRTRRIDGTTLIAARGTLTILSIMTCDTARRPVRDPGGSVKRKSGASGSGVMSAKLLDFGLAKLTAHGGRPALVGEASAPRRIEGR